MPCQQRSVNCGDSAPTVWVPPPPQCMTAPCEGSHAGTSRAPALQHRMSGHAPRTRAGPIAEGKADPAEGAEADVALLPQNGEGGSVAAEPAPEDILWEGSTWDACPLWAACCAPVCSSQCISNAALVLCCRKHAMNSDATSARCIVIMVCLANAASQHGQHADGCMRFWTYLCTCLSCFTERMHANECSASTSFFHPHNTQ